MKVADFTSQTKSPLNLRVTYASGTDLLCSLWIVGDRRCADVVQDLDLGDEWFDAFEDRLSADTKARIDGIGGGDVWIALMPLLPEAGDGSSVDAFISFLEGFDAADLRYRLITMYGIVGDDHRETIADAAEGSSEAVERLLAIPELSKPEKKNWRATLQYLLEMEPEATRDFLVGILKDTQAEAFTDHEVEFRPFLEADYRSKRAMARRTSPERLLEIATSGINFSEDHTRRPIVLMPTMIARPWVVFASGQDFYVLGYPVADEHLDSDGDAPPQWLVKLYKALGDERRLRVLRSLAQGDASLADLADRADIAKSTLHHHLMLLRAAGLVRLHVGEDKRYSLREDTLADAPVMLDHYIHTADDMEEGT